MAVAVAVAAVAVAVAVDSAFAFAFAFAFDFGSPSAATELAGKTRRATHMDVRRFSTRQDVSSKNPAGGVDPARAAGWARRQGRAFSWLLLFARAKRSNSLLRSRGESSAFKLPLLALSLALASWLFGPLTFWRSWPSFWHGRPELSPFSIQRKPEQEQKREQRLSLPFGARATFLCSCKETWPKESTPCLRALRVCGTPGPLRRRDFSTRHPCRVEKRRASMHVAPSGSCPSAPSLRKGTRKVKSNGHSNSQSRPQPVTRRRFSRACAS